MSIIFLNFLPGIGMRIVGLMFIFYGIIKIKEA
jgi:hypothetical protein